MVDFRGDETKSKILLEMGRRGGLVFVKGRWWGIVVRAGEGGLLSLEQFCR
jgi:hypothetical protein